MKSITDSVEDETWRRAGPKSQSGRLALRALVKQFVGDQDQARSALSGRRDPRHRSCTTNLIGLGVYMSRLIPDGFLTIRQAAELLAVAMYSGVPDRPIIKQLREKSGFDVADGQAIEDAKSEIWVAVDRTLQTFAVGAKHQTPLKLSAAMSKEIPGFRSSTGGNFGLLRHSNRNHHQFAEWFGRDLTKVSVVFREAEIRQLARTLLRTRRRKAMSAGTTKVGRPSHKIEVKRIIRGVIHARKWNPTQSIKKLTQKVNSKGTWLHPLSDDTVARRLDELYSETGARRFQRVRRNIARRA
jgi:hypothetical protein